MCRVPPTRRWRKWRSSTWCSARASTTSSPYWYTRAASSGYLTRTAPDTLTCSEESWPSVSAIATREFIRHCLVPSAYMACHNTLHFSRKTYYWISKQYHLGDSKKNFVCECMTRIAIKRLYRFKTEFCISVFWRKILFKIVIGQNCFGGHFKYYKNNLS